MFDGIDWSIEEKMKVEGRNIKRTLYEVKIKSSKNPYLYEIKDIGHVIIDNLEELYSPSVEELTIRMNIIVKEKKEEIEIDEERIKRELKGIKKYVVKKYVVKEDKEDEL